MIAGVIGVESRRKHIEERIVPELKKYCREVTVFYDPTFSTTKRADHNTVLKNAFANQARAYRETFASRIDNEPVIITTDDFIFSKNWKQHLDRIIDAESDCPVFCLYTSRQPETNGKGYWRGLNRMGYYDVASYINIPFDLYKNFEQWCADNSEFLMSERAGRQGLHHHDNLFGFYLADQAIDIIMITPSLVKHELKSEMGHGNGFKNNFIDEVEGN